LHINPEELPVHPIHVVGTGIVSDSISTTNLGIQFDCLVSDYISKDKPSETLITLFHPTGSRLKNQTTMLKRGSSVFFSGALTSIENKLYLELHNFSFIRNQQFNSASKSNKEIPWLNSLSPQSSSSSSSHITSKSMIQKKIGEQRKYTSMPVLGKRKSATTKFQPSKIKKLSDIATNILTEVDKQEGQDEGEGIQQNEIEGEIDQEIREETGEQIPVQGQEIEDQDEQDETQEAAFVKKTKPHKRQINSERGGRCGGRGRGRGGRCGKKK